MTNVVGFHLYELPKTVKYIEAESRLEVSRGQEGGIESYC